MSRYRLPAAGLLLALLAACDAKAPVRQFGADAYPVKLSEWGLMRLADGELVLNDGVVPYDLNTPLFTDYAQKLRTVWMPPDTAAAYHDDESFEFPVGTVISKTFFYPQTEAGLVQSSFTWPATTTTLPTANVRLMETRLLVRQADGWDALPYVWSGDDAYLKIAGALEKLDIELPDGTRRAFPYVVPTRNECASCHATNHSTGELMPIGPKARHLNRAYLDRSGNQLEEWVAEGRLHGAPPVAAMPRNAAFTSDGDGVAERARAYLDANCAHCHNATGAADTSGLLLDADISSARQLGVCKPPIAAGGGSGGRAYSIVPGKPDHSILIYRLETTDPGSMMPELGRSLVHSEGVELLTAWIAGMEGECVVGTAAD